MNKSMPQHNERRLAFSLPNLLTYGRIAAVPALVACYFFKGDLFNWLALGIFAAASITDFFDGYLARIWSQQSAIGRMLDPIADKLLVASALLMLVANGVINGWLLWAALIILSREMLVSGLREYLAEVEVSVPVSRIAKWKTAMQMVSIGFLLSVPAGEKLIPGVTQLGYGLLWLSALLTIYTGYDYLRAGVTHVLGDQ